MALKEKLKTISGSAAQNTKAGLRWILMKVLGVVMAVVFLTLGTILLSYSLVAVATTFRGTDAKVVSVSTQVGKCHTAFRVGGLFQVSVEIEKHRHDKIYCFYPAWPDLLQPVKGDTIAVWPEKQPFVGAPFVEGWGWFLVGTLFVLGLVMLEFAFISFTLR